MQGSKPQYSGLVLAARRPGILDPLARKAGVTHKCLAPINGRPMLERVIEAVLQSGRCRHVYVAIDEAQVLKSSAKISGWIAEGSVSTVTARSTLTDSVFAAADEIPDQNWPIMISTGDNALHTPDIIRDFIDGAEANKADVSCGITREEVVVATLPEAVKAFHRLKDGGFSSCNLYSLKDRNALKSVEVFRGGGQFGKRHRRILKAFGLISFLLYKLKLVTIDQMFRRAGKGFGLKIAAVFLSYDFGPIDVDDQNSFDISEKLLRQREGNRA